MSPAELIALAERCEASTGDERETFAINCDIEALAFDRHSGMMRDFTRLVDDALKLVPPGFDWLVAKYGKAYGAAVHPHGCRDIGDPNSCATAGLALCAAALRAKAEAGQ